MKSRVLLVNPLFEEGMKGFPLGLAYIAGALRESGHEVEAIDLMARVSTEGAISSEILEKKLNSFQPNVVGLTSTSPNHLNAIEVAQIVKEWKNVPIIKGGSHETNCSLATLKYHPEIDYSVVGNTQDFNKRPILTVRLTGCKADYVIRHFQARM